MSKNLAVPGKKKAQFVEVSDILKNSTSKAKLQNFIDETVVCKTKILDQQESIRTLRDAAVEELGIQPKLFSTLVSLYFNNNFDEKRAEIEQISEALDALMQTNPISSDD